MINGAAIKRRKVSGRLQVVPRCEVLLGLRDGVSDEGIFRFFLELELFLLELVCTIDVSRICGLQRFLAPQLERAEVWRL